MGVIAKNFYRDQIGFLMKSELNWLAAVTFYLLFVVGLVLFVIAPALEKRSWLHALGFGALFGLISYATYDLSNLATLKGWPILVTEVEALSDRSHDEAQGVGIVSRWSAECALVMSSSGTFTVQNHAAN